MSSREGTLPARSTDQPSQYTAYALTIALTFGSFAVYSYYFYSLDYAWFSDHLTQNLPKHLRSRLPTLVSINRQATLVPGAIVGTLKPLVMLCGMAAYLMIWSRASGSAVSYKEAFRRSAIVSFPFILVLPLEAFNIYHFQSGQLAPEDLDITTLNALLFHASPGTFLYAIGSSISIAFIWSGFLFVLVVRSSLKCSSVRALPIALLPFILSIAPSLGLIKY